MRTTITSNRDVSSNGFKQSVCHYIIAVEVLCRSFFQYGIFLEHICIYSISRNNVILLEDFLQSNLVLFNLWVFPSNPSVPIFFQGVRISAFLNYYYFCLTYIFWFNHPDSTMWRVKIVTIDL
jgi:hypothetical protein